MIELVRELEAMVTEMNYKMMELRAQIDAPARRAYMADLNEKEKTSTIHTNRWARSWNELSETEKDEWRAKI